jgi:hypothetical protein
MKRYASFVVRCWYGAEEVMRIDVEHMQTQERIRFASLEAAMRWIEERGECVDLEPEVLSTQARATAQAKGVRGNPTPRDEAKARALIREMLEERRRP